MSQECPNCGQLTNTSYSRLVKDTCGHTKCRMCLLYEEHGCKTCQTEHYTQGIQDYREPCPINGDAGNNYDSISTESRSSDRENVTFNNDNERTYESTTSDAVSNNDSDKLYIPKIEPSNMVLNIHAHLRNGSHRSDSDNLQNRQNNQVEEKLERETLEKNKNPKYRDRSHITIVSRNPEKYKCNVCGKIFRNKKGKCYHDACVTGVKPYQCTFCDRSFVKRSHFEYHERVHRGYRPYKCSLCDKAFPQQNKLNRHMLSHNKEKQFVCSTCNKRYSKRDDLKNHLNQHNSTTTYTCMFCDKPFRILTNLRRHMRTHTSERPHTCDQCNKSFKDNSVLIRHKRIHGKERPFSCAHCNRVFLSKSELRRHLVVHSGEKPFSCKYCQTQFRRKDNLNRHIKHHHLEDSNYDEANSKTPPVVDKADRSRTKKNNSHSRQRQKSKIQPKSPNKVTSNSFANSRQINSRLDSMGNITPVIRTIGEVSNAVSVINGPIRLDERTHKKMFTYMEPIPIAEAAVLNCRIEEKLYPKSANSHTYYVHNYLKDGNSKVNSYPNNNNNINNSNLSPQENSDFIAMMSSQIEPFPPRTMVNQKEPVTDICNEKNDQNENKTRKEGGRNQKKNGNLETTEYLDATLPRNEQSNCVSTIKIHTIQQSDKNTNDNSASNNSEPVNHVTLPKHLQDNSKRKQSDVHWRRRTAETLKPCNR